MGSDPVFYHRRKSVVFCAGNHFVGLQAFELFRERSVCNGRQFFGKLVETTGPKGKVDEKLELPPATEYIEGVFDRDDVFIAGFFGSYAHDTKIRHITVGTPDRF